jgi:hypothetical protein
MESPEGLTKQSREGLLKQSVGGSGLSRLSRAVCPGSAPKLPPRDLDDRSWSLLFCTQSSSWKNATTPSLMRAPLPLPGDPPP